MTDRVVRLRPASLGATLPDETAAERRTAIRALLADPLLVETPATAEVFGLVVRHERVLREWFTEKTGWHLLVDGRSGVARLRKQVGLGNADPTRGAQVPGTGRRFSRRTYVLYCLACAELDRANAPQVLLSAVAEGIRLRSGTEDAIAPFSGESRAERQALIDALRLLEAQGVLRLVDGDVLAYLDGQDADGLYMLDRDRLGRLVATAGAPSLARDLATLLDDPMPVSREGTTRWSRQHLMRRLLDDPVVYDEDLTAGELDYLRSQRAAIAAWLEEAGLRLERRAEGLAAIDEAGELTDEAFPSPGTVGHAALLVAEALVRLTRPGARTLDPDAYLRLVRALLDQNRGHWARTLTERTDAVEAIASEAAALLGRFRLARPEPDGGITALPAVARFASTELDAVTAAIEQLALPTPEV